MNYFTVLIKIKDFFPKFEAIPFDNYLCIFTNNEFEGRISLTQYKYQYIKHEIKDINTDIKYKILVTDFISKKQIGVSDYVISYNKINRLNIGTSINFITHLKVVLNQKIKTDLFGSNYFNTYKNDIYLTISTEIIKYNKYNNGTNTNLFCKLNIKKNLYINDTIKTSKDKDKNKNNIKQINNRNSIKNQLEYIKIKKVDNNNKNERINRNINEKKLNNNNNIISKSSKHKKNNNKLEMIYKGEYSSPLIITENDKKNINLNMHNICVQNYYTITSSLSPLNGNTIIKKEKTNENYLDKNKIYTKKSANNKIKKKNSISITNSYDLRNYFNLGIKKNLTNYFDNLKNIKKDNNRYDLYKLNSNNKNENININKSYKNNKSKEKEKQSECEYNNNRFKHFELLNNNSNNCFNIVKRNLKKNRANKSHNKIYSSVDKIKNNIHYNKIIKINNLFTSSTIDYPKMINNITMKKKKASFSSNLSNYLNSMDNNNYNMTSSSFLNKKNFKNKYKLDKIDNFISPKSHTLRDNSKENKNISLKKRTHKSICDLNSVIKNNNSVNRINHISMDENDTISLSNIKTNINKSKNDINYKEKILNSLEFYLVLSKKIQKLFKVYEIQKSKFFLFKEKYLNILQKKNIILQRMNINKYNNFIHVNINCLINNKIMPKIKAIKENELNIYQNIFNVNINNNDILNELKEEYIEKDNNSKKLLILLTIIKNLINKYGNISQIYKDDIQKKKQLLVLLINNGIEINDMDFLYQPKTATNKKNEINNKYNCKEIKEEIEEEEEEDNEENDEDKEDPKLNISVIYKNDNIIDKILIEDFPKKYENITDKKFIKLGPNEYLFNNELKIFAFYKDDEVFLQIENDNNNNNNNSSYDSYNKEYSLDEFVSKYAKKKNNNLNKKKNCYSPIRIKKNIFNMAENKKFKSNYYLKRNNNKKKIFKRSNLCQEKCSRNHNIINDIEYNQEDFKKKFLNGKILLTNESFVNDENNNSTLIKENKENKENKDNKENKKNNDNNNNKIEKIKDQNINNSDKNINIDNNNNCEIKNDNDNDNNSKKEINDEKNIQH